MLKREGHPAGAGRWRLSDADWDHFNTHPVTRDTGHIGRVIDDVRAARAELDREHWPYLDAIDAAIAWATTGSGAAPMTARPILADRPSWVEICEEIDIAEDVLYGQRRDERDQGYAVGVEHALMWLINDTDEPPG